MGVQQPRGQVKGQSKQNWLRRLVGFFRRDSLRKSLVFAVLLVSLLPVILVGTVSYYRTRSQIQSLVANQLYQITNSSARQVDEFAQSRSDTLSQLAEDQAFLVTLQTSLDPNAALTESSAAALNLRTQLVLAAQGVAASEPVFSQLFVLDDSGAVVASSDSQFIYDNFGTGKVVHPAVKPLINTSKSSPAFNPFRSTGNGLVLLTSYQFEIPNQQRFTIIGVSSTLLYSRMLTQAAAFLPGARAFYMNTAGEVITNAVETPLEILPLYEPFFKAVSPIISGAQTLQPITFSSYGNQIVMAYVHTIPDQGLSLILQVPISTLYGEVPVLDSFSIYMLVFLMIALAGLAYIGTSQVVNPLLHLSDVASKFAEGKFQNRAVVNRKDEIGSLAQSMNKMAAELSTLYADLEGKVQQRTRQLRAASEVAHIATSSSNLEDILNRTVNLLGERFNLYSTAIYLTDETRRFLVLREVSTPGVENALHSSRRLPINSSTLPGWAAERNQIREIPDVEQEPLYLPDSSLPYTRSMAVIPISSSNDVLGVLEVRSNQPGAFDADLHYVLQTVANQVAAAIQNIRLLETAHVDLEETSLLYRLTRKVSEASTEQDALNAVIENLPRIQHTSALLSMDGDNIHIIALYDPRTRKMERGLNTIDIPARRVSTPLQQGEPIFITDITLPSEYDNILSFFLRRGCHSAVILPCMQAGKPSKILVVGFEEDQAVSQSMLQPYINLAEVISANLDKFDLLQSLQQRLSELQVLATFSRAASAETNLQELLKTLHQLVMETMGDDLGFVLALYKADREMIEFPYAYEDQQLLELDPIPVGNGLTSYIIQNRKPLLLIKDTEQQAAELGARIIGKPAKSWLGVPLIVGGQLIGALILQDQDEEERFSQDDLNLFMTLAPQIATTIRNTQLLDEMQAALSAYEQERLLLSTWLNNTPNSIVIQDVHGTYLRTSRSVANQFNLRPEIAVGKSDFDLLPQEIASRIYAGDKSVIETGEARIGDMEELSLGGKSTWQLVSRIPVREPDGSVVGIMAIRRNITELKHAEAYAKAREDQIRTTAEITRDSAGILDLDELLDKAVNLVRERFGFYHASVFLLDALGEYAELRESTGEAGRQMKANHHRLAVGSRSIVGQATAHAEAVIVPDVTRDPTHFPNPLLPDTRAELAIPLIYAGRLIGALDVQSTIVNAFDPNEIEILGILADQVATAIHNAGLYASAQEMLGKHKLLHQINVAATTADSLDESLDKVASGLSIAQVADHIGIFILNRNNELELAAASGYQGGQTPALRVPLGHGLVGSAAQERRAIRVDNVLNDPRYIQTDEHTRSELALPIVFGEELIGALNLEVDQPAAFDDNDLDIMAALANNLGAVIANWRLVEQIRRQVDRQRLLYEVTSRIRRSVDIPTILQTSVSEIGRTVGARRASISLSAPQIDPETHPSPTNGNGHNGSKEGM